MVLQTDDYPGAQINGYFLVEHIASENFGELYRAEHPGRSGSVAVKLLSKAQLLEEKGELFCINEQLLLKLSHPHLLPILELEHCKDQMDDHRCQPYVIMPYAAHGTLRARIQQRSGQPFPLDEVLNILTPIGQALQYLHQHDIVHRGVQPESILFNEQDRPLLGGLDLAIVDGTQYWERYIKFYHAPEQLYGMVNKQCDQFALACIAYELLTGQHPFSPGLATELSNEEQRKALTTYISPRSLNPTIPASVEKAIAKALSLNSGDRYPDIMTFLAALGAPSDIIIIVKQAQVTPVQTAQLKRIQSDYTNLGRPSEPSLTSGSTRLSGSAISASENNVNDLQSARSPALASSTEGSTDFVVITALREELDALLEKLPSYQQLPPADEDWRIYYQADLPVTFSGGATSTYHLVLLSLLGMGRVQAANAVNDAIRRWHPRYILLVGIAGGIAEAKVKRGDILIADQVVDYELQKLTETGPQIRWEVHRADPRLLEAARNLGNNWRRRIKKRRPQKGIAECFIGPVATGDKVIAIKEAIEQLRTDWPKLIGIEMEAGGAASAAFQAARQPGFLMIRGVSDLADENKDDTWRQYACHSAAAYAITLLQNGPVTPSRPEKANKQGSEIISPEKQVINPLPFKPIQSDEISTKLGALRNLAAAASIPTPEASEPLEIFLSYAKEDEELAKRLLDQLAVLKQRKLITDWHAGKITPNQDVDEETMKHLNTAHIILLLISPSFMASEQHACVEVIRAMERRKTEGTTVVPVLLRATASRKDAPFGGLLALPRNGKAIAEWSSRDAAFAQVAEEIRDIVNSL